MENKKFKMSTIKVSIKDSLDPLGGGGGKINF